MSKYRYVVHGAAGQTGVATVYDLMVFGEAKSINAVDPSWKNWDKLHHDVRHFENLLGKNRADKIRYFDNPSPLAWGNADVAISCAPHSANVELTEQAVEYGIPFCDLGGCPSVVEKQKLLAKNARTPVVPDCGVSPGLSNILAVHLVKKYGSRTLRVRCGGNPLFCPDPKKNPLRYKLVYSPEGTASGYTGSVYEIHNGQIVQVPALSRVIRFDSEFESSPTSHNSLSVVKNLLSLGVQEYDYGTLRYFGHYNELFKNGWNNSCDPEELAQWLRNKTELVFHRGEDKDRMTLIVEEDMGGKNRHRYDVRSHRNTGFTAMELMTSWGISIVAHHMASWRWKPLNFTTPEQFVDTDWVVAEVEKRQQHYRSRDR